KPGAAGAGRCSYAVERLLSNAPTKVANTHPEVRLQPPPRRVVRSSSKPEPVVGRGGKPICEEVSYRVINQRERPVLREPRGGRGQLRGRRRRGGLPGIAGRRGGGLGNRGELVGNRIGGGGIGRWLVRGQLRGGRRRGGIAVHGGGILGPHFHVLGFGGRNRRGVLPEEIGRDERHQQHPVGRDQRWSHRHRKRGL